MRHGNGKFQSRLYHHKPRKIGGCKKKEAPSINSLRMTNADYIGAFAYFRLNGLNSEVACLGREGIDYIVGDKVEEIFTNKMQCMSKTLANEGNIEVR